MPHHIREPPLITAVTDISTLTYTMTEPARAKAKHIVALDGVPSRSSTTQAPRAVLTPARKARPTGSQKPVGGFSGSMWDPGAWKNRMRAKLPARRERRCHPAPRFAE